jgi:ankyrin repeat protein
MSLVMPHVEYADLARLVKTSRAVRMAAAHHPAHSLWKERVDPIALLHSAVQLADARALEWLCQGKYVADLNARHKDGSTALSLASQNGHDLCAPGH